MNELFDMNLTYWHWLVFALFMLGLELFAPGAVFLWFGIAAGITAALVFVIPSTLWQIQFLVFSITSVVSIVAYWSYKRKHPSPQHDQPSLNRRGEQLIGRILHLDEPASNGSARVKIGDTMWKVTSPDLPAGTRVKVVSVEGAVPRVEPVEE